MRDLDISFEEDKMRYFIPGRRIAVITTLVLSACGGAPETGSSRQETPPTNAREAETTTPALVAPDTGPVPASVAEPETAVASSPAAGLKVVTDESFQAEVLDAEGLVLVDFGAAWCGPCRLNRPSLEQLASAYAGRIKVTTLDVDANPRTAARYEVRSIPALLLFKGGERVDEVIGAAPRAALERKIQEHL
jgi:thioredoxin 1